MVYDLCDKKLWKRSGLGLGILYIHRWARCTIGVISMHHRGTLYAPLRCSVCTIEVIIDYGLKVR